MCSNPEGGRLRGAAPPDLAVRTVSQTSPIDHLGRHAVEINGDEHCLTGVLH